MTYQAAMLAGTVQQQQQQQQQQQENVQTTL
jgi:hypothetical protein